MLKIVTHTKELASSAQRWLALRKVIREANGAYVAIGVHAGAGKYPGPNAPEVVEVALWNEFGTPNAKHPVPERSFVRSAIDENQERIFSWREEAINNILEKGWSVEKALSMIGFRIQILIQNKIKSNVPPPNAPTTVKAKELKSSNHPHETLQDTELLLRSVTFKVFSKKEAK